MKPGRPSFPLEPGRLKGLREELGLTLQAVANELYGGRTVSLHTAIVNYQRIERQNRTSPKTAARLAQILGTTLAVLQGQTPDDAPRAIDRVEAQLRRELARGTNRALAAAVEKEGGEDPVRSLAADYARFIEVAQFGRDAFALRQLGELTGWSDDELMQPLSVDGHFLVLSSVHGTQSHEIAGSAPHARRLVIETREKFARFRGSDASATLREAPPWLHVDFHHPGHAAARTTFSIVRCQPVDTGLRWVNPTWRDRLQLHDVLDAWVRHQVNFVTGLDGRTVPSDVRRLALEFVHGDAADDAEPIAVFRHVFDEHDEAMLARPALQDETHDTVTAWLVGNLFASIEPHLRDWPLDCWRIESGGLIALRVDVPWRRWEDRATPPPAGILFALRLVEERPDGTRAPAPWRSESAEQAAQILRRQLAARVADAGPPPRHRR